MSRPYVYHYANAFARSHKLSQAIARKELDKAGFGISSTPAAWGALRNQRRHDRRRDERPVIASKTYVHVLATANADGPAKKWATEINPAINESKMQLID